MTRGELRERLLATATDCGTRHALSGTPSLRLRHTSDYIARIIAGQAGVGSFSKRAIDAHTVAATYSAAYAAAALRGTP